MVGVDWGDGDVLAFEFEVVGWRGGGSVGDEGSEFLVGRWGSHGGRVGGCSGNWHCVPGSFNAGTSVTGP